MITLKFNFQGENYELNREIENFDRNYDDESYGIVYLDYGLDRFFEINVLKDESGNFTEDAYVAVYHHEDDNRPYCYISDVAVYLQRNEDTETIEKVKEKRIQDLINAWRKISEWVKNYVGMNFIDGYRHFLHGGEKLIFVDNVGDVYFGVSQGRSFYGDVFHGDYYYDCFNISLSSNNDIGNRIENPKYEKMRLFDALKDERRREIFTELIVSWGNVKSCIIAKKTSVSRIEDFQV